MKMRRDMVGQADKKRLDHPSLDKLPLTLPYYGFLFFCATPQSD